jgi:hypothetical protein
MPQAFCILAAALTLGTCVSYVWDISPLDASPMHWVRVHLRYACIINNDGWIDRQMSWVLWDKCFEPRIFGSKKTDCLVDYTKALILRIWHVETWTITTQHLRSESNLELRIMGRWVNGRTVPFCHDIYLPVGNNLFTCQIEPLKS